MRTYNHIFHFTKPFEIKAFLSSVFLCITTAEVPLNKHELFKVVIKLCFRFFLLTRFAIEEGEAQSFQMGFVRSL